MTASAGAATTQRSHLAGDLSVGDVGSRVRLGGWVQRSRDLGGISFLELRDRAGQIQLALNPEWTPADVIAQGRLIPLESVVLAQGEVALRPADMRNATIANGDIEVRVTALRVVGCASPQAIPVASDKGANLPSEELRLRYRYLDLRRPELQRNLMLRHRLQQSARAYLSNLGYLEVETPILTRPTPEGARDYLVPSRVHAGEFYALPQSPQLYKQLLMISGYDRYFQLARCFRDEDLRADRQPEFTQIDIEASFVGPEDIYQMAEGLLVKLFAEAEVAVPAPFRRMTYADAMERYGTDRPDLRYDLYIEDFSALFAGVELGITQSALAAGGRVRGIRVAGGATLSRKQIDALETAARGAGASGLLRLKQVNGSLEGPAAKFIPAERAAALGAADGDLMLMVAGPDHLSSPALDRVRQALAGAMGLIPEGAHELVWITHFPMFVADPAGGALLAVHHPFTAPHPDDIALLDSDPMRVRALAYDVVLNGTELGGGSIRISDPVLQKRALSLLGMDDQTARARFGFLLEALAAGAPPHGGIALGFDRIAMLLAGASSLRDVIAFPKTTAARALFEGAPSPVPAEDLADLHLSTTDA